MQPKVSLRKITDKNVRACCRLSVADSQHGLVASNAFSIAEAYTNPELTPLAVYDGEIFGNELQDSNVVVGFTMYQVVDEVGYIVRLMIGEGFQRRGYGRATMVEVIRRLKLEPEVRVIGTSYVPHNDAAAELYRGLGFVPWEPPPDYDDSETVVRLDWAPE